MRPTSSAAKGIYGCGGLSGRGFTWVGVGEFAGFSSVAPGPYGIEFQFYMKDKDSVLRYSALDSCTAL